MVEPIKTAVLLCGGYGKYFGKNKGLIEYKQKSMISHVLRALKKTSVSNLIVKTNYESRKIIFEEVKRYFKNFTFINKKPKTMRYCIMELSKYLDDKPFFVVVGNNPMKEDYLLNLEKIRECEDEWVVSLYDKCICDEKCGVDIDNQNNIIIKKRSRFILQHPFIITKDIIKYQKNTNFNEKIEFNLRNLVGKRKIKGVISNMPPEFDNNKMLERTKKFIDLLN